MGSRVILLGCKGETHPAICFALDVARCEYRIVFDESELLNLQKITQQTGELFDALLVDTPYLNVDIVWLVEQWQRLETQIPMVFVKRTEPLTRVVLSLLQRFAHLNLHLSEPTDVADLVLLLTAQRQARNNNLNNTDDRGKSGWRWQWKKRF